MAVIRIGRVQSKMSRLRGDLVGLVVLSLVVSSFANPAGKGCDSVKRQILLRGFSADGLLDTPQNGKFFISYRYPLNVFFASLNCYYNDTRQVNINR